MVPLMVLIFTFLCNVLCENPIVHISHGALKGVWKESTKGRQYASFNGIPYAKPPIGEYRFKDPQPVEPWQGVWDASQPLAHCLQYDPASAAIVGSEDCLFINVHVPKLETEELLPVVVYIHSGAFMFGAGSLYGPAHLMDKDVVVVTFNYRLGPFGFLSTGDKVVSGNAGLKDQAFALRWVQDNIKTFGGNPNSVTLTGCSAGSASVHYQYLSPLSKGTFHRGMAFSGSAFASWAYATKPLEKTKVLANLVGCTTQNNIDMVECLRKRPGDMILNTVIQMFAWKAHMFIPFLPTMEAAGTEGAFITEYPYFAARAGSMHRLPLIVSLTSAEGLYPAAYYQKEESLLSEIEERWEEIASDLFFYNDTVPFHRHSEVAKKIKQHYLGDKPVSQETFPPLVEALGDRHFAVSIGKLAQLHAKSGQPTYMYRYNYRGTHSLSNHISGNKNDYGVSHADDIMEIFQFLWTSDAEQDVKMRDSLLHMVYSFATSGVPKIPNSPQWTPVKTESEELNFLDISGPNNIEMKVKADFGRRSFWDSLGLKEYDNFNALARDEL